MPDIYDPNCEGTNEEKVVAGHWECLRRNKEFRAASEQWLQSEKFRRAHALSQNYHNQHNHTPRCAWDWMLTAAQRVRLAKFQIEKQKWFFDNNYNFGPVICHENFQPAALRRKNWRDFLRVEPLADAPPPITVSQPWNCTADLFKKQFRLAYRSTEEFGEVNASLKEHGICLAQVASRLAADDPVIEVSVIAGYLFALGSELRELAEFSKVFKIPKRTYSEKRFASFLDQIHDSFKASKLLLPTKKYDTHQSFQGTNEDWCWFLKAEEFGLDIRQSGDCAQLAAIYSEDVRRRAMHGMAPRRAKSHGFTGSKIPSKTIKNRRSTVKRHVLAIEKWIIMAYSGATRQEAEKDT